VGGLRLQTTEMFHRRKDWHRRMPQQQLPIEGRAIELAQAQHIRHPPIVIIAPVKW